MRHAVLVLLTVLGVAGCDDLSMAKQRKDRTYAPSGFWPDGASARHPPEGTVAQGDLARDASAARPAAVTDAVMARGQERYEIFCAPCHGLTGDGRGMIPARGFPRPPSYHTDRLRAAPADHLFGVITNGYGVMYGYASRVPPEDRWAIIAYVRALQQAEHSRVADLSPDAARRLP